MKKFLTLKNLILCGVSLLALLVFIFSFSTNVNMYDAAGNLTGRSLAVIWGGKTDIGIGYVLSVKYEYPVAANHSALALPLIGSLLVFLAGICALCLGLFGEKFLKDAKTLKICMFVLAGLMVLGGVFVLLTPLSFFNVIAKERAELQGVDVETMKELMKAQGGTLKSTKAIVSGIMAILGGAAVVVSQLLPAKKD